MRRFDNTHNWIVQRQLYSEWFFGSWRSPSKTCVSTHSGVEGGGMICSILYLLCGYWFQTNFRFPLLSNHMFRRMGYLWVVSIAAAETMYYKCPIHKPAPQIQQISHSNLWIQNKCSRKEHLQSCVASITSLKHIYKQSRQSSKCLHKTLLLH